MIFLLLRFSSTFLSSMAEEAESSLEKFKSEGHSAFVLGYTGEVGRQLVEELNRLKLFKRVVLIGRRNIPLSVGSEFVSHILGRSLMIG